MFHFGELAPLWKSRSIFTKEILYYRLYGLSTNAFPGRKEISAAHNKTNEPHKLKEHNGSLYRAANSKNRSREMQADASVGE